MGIRALFTYGTRLAGAECNINLGFPRHETTWSLLLVTYSPPLCGTNIQFYSPPLLIPCLILLTIWLIPCSLV